MSSSPPPTGTASYGVDSTRTPTDLELHSGLVLGDDPGATARRRLAEAEAAGEGPRRVLEERVGGALRQGPCVVTFSGGRDSSLVLAVAAHVARRDGYDLPTAVTVRYPGIADADESEWQDLVVGRLGVPQEIVEVQSGSDEIAGPFGVAQLRRHGPGLPPTAGVSLGRIGPVVGGRTVLTGQGGDEVLGESRISAFVAHWRRRRRPSRSAAAGMAGDLLPRAARRVAARRELRAEHPTPWLRSPAREEVTREVVEAMTQAPWDWRTARWVTLDSRLWAVGSASLARVARGEGFTVIDPLMDPRFIAAVCRLGGRFGLATRTEAMRVLAEDILPLKLLRRSTKAAFEHAYAGERTRAFAREWDGGGVDPELVDVERLRAAWVGERIPVASLAPLQLALLHATRHGWEPRPHGQGVA